MKVTGRIHRVAFLVFALLIFCTAPGWSQGYERKVEMSWDFTTATTPLGRNTYEQSVSNFGLSNGSLIFHATEQAWILKNTVISVPGAPLQLVEIVMSSYTTGRVKLSYFYGESRESAGWSGFDSTILADGSFHHYYFPLTDTSPATTTYELGLMPPAGSTIAVRSMALVTLVPSTTPPVSPLWQFDTDGDAKGWVPYSGVLDMTVTGGRLRLHALTNATILAPPAQVTYQTEWFSLLGSVTQSDSREPMAPIQFCQRRKQWHYQSVRGPCRGCSRPCVQPECRYCRVVGDGLAIVDYPIGEHDVCH